MIEKLELCPRCGKAVSKAERHELRFQLVNADEGAPRGNVDLHAVFHHRCASAIWNTARREWFGLEQV